MVSLGTYREGRGRSLLGYQYSIVRISSGDFKSIISMAAPGLPPLVKLVLVLDVWIVVLRSGGGVG